MKKKKRKIYQMIQNKLSNKALAALGYSPNESLQSLLNEERTLLWKLVDVERIIALLTVVFGVMIAIAWDAVIVATFIIGDQSGKLNLLFIYAIILTIVGFSMGYAVGKIAGVE
ncbi:MAG: DUF5654 family protein [Methanobacterium sp.]